MIRAEDPGKLSTTATVNIKVTDINDNNPKFDEDSYTFHVKEGTLTFFLFIWYKILFQTIKSFTCVSSGSVSFR